MRKILNRFLLATLAAAAVWACGGNGSSDGTGGTGGSGGSGGSGGQTGAPGTCGNPINFNAVEVLDNEENEYVSGKLEDGRSEISGTCGGNKGNELVYKWTAPSDGVLTFVGLQSGANVIVYASPVCGSPDDEVVCVGGDGAGRPVGAMKRGESIYIVADARKDGANEFQIKLSYSPILDLNDPCRPDGRTGVCRFDAQTMLVCDNLVGFCAKDTPPEIKSIRLLRTPTKAAYMEIEGKDAEANANHWYGKFWDKDGKPVPVFEGGANEGHVDFTNGILGKKNFTATWEWPDFFTGFPDVATVEVSLVEYDKLWEDVLLFSEPVTVDVQDGAP